MRRARGKGHRTLDMNDKQIETMLRQLIEEHLADDALEAALDWLDKRITAYHEIQELGLLDQNEDGFDEDE